MTIIAQTSWGTGLALYIIFVVVGIILAVALAVVLLTSAVKAKRIAKTNPQNKNAQQHSKILIVIFLVLFAVPICQLFLWILSGLFNRIF